MGQSIPVNIFMDKALEIPVVDVRTPAEFEQGHIPKAHNIPLFSDRERAEIGTIYKHNGRETSIRRGLEIIGPRMRSLVEQSESVAREKKLLVHCWRGGMRSESMAWLLNFSGIDATTLEGGYKKFRHWALDSFEIQLSWIVLGGMTGSGKTHILHELAHKGEQVIDLENMANHKGSAFGALGENPQPTNEQFENNLARLIRSLDPARRVWIEDESRHIGRIILHKHLFEQMRKAPVIEIKIPQNDRLQQLVNDYSNYPVDALEKSIRKISERLGGLHTRLALEALEEADYKKVAELTLLYYDKAYSYGLQQREADCVHSLSLDGIDPVLNAEQVLKFAGGIPTRMNI